MVTRERVAFQPLCPFEFGAAIQANVLTRLVASERDQLVETRPNILCELETAAAATATILRLARCESIEANIIMGEASDGESDKLVQPIGLATAYSRRTVLHPSIGLRLGTYVDFWLRSGEELATRRAVMEKMLRLYGGQLAFTAVQEGSLNAHPDIRSVYINRMLPAGTTEDLSLGKLDGITSDFNGQPAQLFVYEPPSAVRSIATLDMLRDLLHNG